MHFRSLVLMPLLLVFVLGGCDNRSVIGGGPIDEGGTCDNVFDHPLINVTEVVDASTQDPIAEVRLANIRVGGLALADSANLFTPHEEFYGINILPEGSLRCTVPCGFGMIEGLWRFTVEHQAYITDSVQVQAAYGNVSAGCPVVFRNGISVSVELEPSG